MPLNDTQSKQISELLKSKIRKKLTEYNPETDAMPFHVRLLGKDRMAVFSFVQSINTMLGSSIFEQTAAIIANPLSDFVAAKHRIKGGISEAALLEIEKIVTSLRESSISIASEKAEDERVRRVASIGKVIPQKKLNVDLFLIRKGVEQYFELKTVKPNIDVFTATKVKMLKWKAARYAEDRNLRIKCYVAFPYNPEAPKPYSRWTLQGLFDVPNEVLVAEEFWDFLGGEGVYEELLDIFEKTGIELRGEIDAKFTSLAKM